MDRETMLQLPSTKEITQAGRRLVLRLDKVRNYGCVQGIFAEFLGEPVIQNLRAIASENNGLPEELLISFRAGLEGLYSFGSSWGHALSRPYGYPGDFGIMEALYDLKYPDSETGSAVPVDIWGIDMVLPRAVRARKDTLRYFLEKEIKIRGKSKILSFASGSARELRELLPGVLKDIEIILFDQDPRALLFAETLLKTKPFPVSVTAIQGDAIQGKNIEAVTTCAPYDIIYSFGLFDYLPDHVLLQSAANFIPMLEDDGLFIFCLKDRRFYDPWFYEWFFDWKFVPRTIDDGAKLAKRMGVQIERTLIIESRTIAIFVCKKLTPHAG